MKRLITLLTVAAIATPALADYFDRADSLDRPILDDIRSIVIDPSFNSKNIQLMTFTFSESKVRKIVRDLLGVDALVKRDIYEFHENREAYNQLIAKKSEVENKHRAMLAKGSTYAMFARIMEEATNDLQNKINEVSTSSPRIIDGAKVLQKICIMIASNKAKNLTKDELESFSLCSSKKIQRTIARGLGLETIWDAINDDKVLQCRDKKAVPFVINSIESAQNTILDSSLLKKGAIAKFPRLKIEFKTMVQHFAKVKRSLEKI